MKSFKKILFSIVCSLVSIGVYIYLSYYYYQLKFGLTHEKSLCEINALFDCAVVSASPYSSFFGIPISLFGFSLHLVLLLMLFSYYFYLVDLRERLGRFCFYLSSLAAFSSLVMGFISVFFLNAYCLFCWVLYLLSFVQWDLLRRVQSSFSEKKDFSRIREILDFSWSKKGILGLFLIPVLSFFIHKSWIKSYGLSDTNILIASYIQEWKSDSFFALDVPPSLAKGPLRGQAELVISEYADFLCSHCKHASSKLRTFSKAYPKVRLEFYHFPLDGDCNKEVSYKSHLSCRLAKAVHCASKWNQGWNLHDEIFLNQSSIRGTSLAELDEFLQDVFLKKNLSWEKGLECIKSPETEEAISQQVEQAKKLEILGTPSFFVNGKKLSSAQWLPLLEAVRKESIREKKK